MVLVLSLALCVCLNLEVPFYDVPSTRFAPFAVREDSTRTLISLIRWFGQVRQIFLRVGLTFRL